jgi:hypothetical protein
LFQELGLECLLACLLTKTLVTISAFCIADLFLVLVEGLESLLSCSLYYRRMVYEILHLQWISELWAPQGTTPPTFIPWS